MISKRMVIASLSFALGLVLLRFYFVRSSPYRFVGIVHYAPQSCISAGIGCYESYIDLGSERCAISEQYAKDYNGQKITVNGSMQRTANTPLCEIKINYVRS